MLSESSLCLYKDTLRLTAAPSAWEEIHDVFGDGHEYDWALAGDDEVDFDEEMKPDMKYQDVGSTCPSSCHYAHMCIRFSNRRKFARGC